MDVSSFLDSLRESSGGSETGTTVRFNNADGLTSAALSPEKSSLVDLFPSPGVATISSPYLKLKSLVNSSWPTRSDPGRFVSVHKAGVYYAHVTTTYGPNDKDLGAVRVVNRDSGERTLIKGTLGKILDISFAHLDLVVIGCVDDIGDLYVYTIKEGSDKKLQRELLLHIHYEDFETSIYNLISWCPFMHDEDKSDEGLESLSLAISHKNSAEIISIKSVIREHGPGRILASSIKAGRLRLEDRKHPITAIQISPDGTAVATASTDGVIQFFQIYFASGEVPRCLHSWKPYGSNEVSSLFFLDDLTFENRKVLDFWSYALTGFNNNKGLMLWRCNDWTCMQVIRINSPVSMLKASLDLTSRILLLSDIVKMNLYVFKIEFTQGQMRIVSVAEFATLNPFFSIAIREAGVKKLGDLHIKDTTLSEDEDEDDFQEASEVLNESHSHRETNVIQLYLAYPRGLQECRIVYNNPPLPESTESEDKLDGGKQHLSKLQDKSSSTPSKLDTAAKQLMILSPEMLSDGQPPAPSGAAQPPPVSGGSSPSREVQDILGDSTHELGEDIVVTECPFDDESDELEDEEEEVEIDVDEEGNDMTCDDMLKHLIKNMINKDPPEWEPEGIKSSSPPPPGGNVLSKSLDIGKDEEENKKFKNKKNNNSQHVSLNGSLQDSKLMSGQNNINNNVSSSSDSSDHLNPPSQPPSSSNELLLLKKMDEMLILIRKESEDLKKVKEDIKELKKMKSDNRAFNQRLRDHEKSIGNKIQSSLKAEMQIVSSSLQNTYRKDSRDALSKVVHSKQFLDSLSTSLTDFLAPVMTESFKEVFMSVVVSAFERAIQSLFTQISTTFNKGLKDYESLVRAHLKESIGNEQANLVRELREGILQLNSEKNADIKRKETDRLVNEVKKIVEEALVRANTTSSEAESAAKSDVVVLHKIQMLLKESKYNEAFKVALSSNSLPIAVATCQMVDPGIIFGTETCPLEQSVILALIQHCATDLEEHTALKLRYLEEAIMNVDANYPPLEANANVFVAKVVQSMQSYIQAHPNTKFSKSLKLHLMAVKSFIKD
eukprot:TRINITY_DN23_c0_g2_i1.p1 TRINITY_DN23_c0_g2~~TRINITY_DN23_c0_g2_i1.p1  ORF type:complete len:1060 (-),score=377.18 TRINITY_DN23_c0_g2_i1:160-3339(-)